MFLLLALALLITISHAADNCCAEAGKNTCSQYAGNTQAQAICNTDQTTCEKAFTSESDTNSGCSGTWIPYKEEAPFTPGILNIPDARASGTLDTARPANYYLPLGVDSATLSTTKRPLIIALPGYTDTNPPFVKRFGLIQSSSDLGAILVAPNGRTNVQGITFWAATDGGCCDNAPGKETRLMDDVTYLKGLITAAKAKWMIDESRIAFVGHSNGAFMANRMACEYSDVVTHAITYSASENLNSTKCKATNPVSVMQSWGTVDELVFYDGGKLMPAAANMNEMMSCMAKNCPRAAICLADQNCNAVQENCPSGVGADPSCVYVLKSSGAYVSQAARVQYLTDVHICGTRAQCFGGPMFGYPGAVEQAGRWRTRNKCNSNGVTKTSLNLHNDVQGAESTPVEYSCERGTKVVEIPMIDATHNLGTWNSAAQIGKMITDFVKNNPRAAKDSTGTPATPAPITSAPVASSTPVTSAPVTPCADVKGSSVFAFACSGIALLALLF